MATLILLLLCTSTAHADAPLEVELARVAVHESGFDAPGDALAIWSVLSWRAQNVRRLRETCDGDLRCVAHAYAAGRGYREAWIGELTVPPTRPPSWPANVSWQRYGARGWLRLVTLARRWLAGEVAPVCDAQPAHWGSRSIATDVRRAERAMREGRWRAVRCYQSPRRLRRTRNGFYTITRSGA